MSFSDHLTISGIIVSVLFGLLGIYFFLRQAKYPGSITFVREQSVALLEDFARKIPNLSVHYKDIPIEKSVILLSGYLVNDGSVDITKEMTEQQLTCELPGGCSWLEFKVTTTAPALKVESPILESNKVMLSFGLFRRGESFSFQALALMDEDHSRRPVRDSASEISWTHRIASLGDVNTIKMPLLLKPSKAARWGLGIIFLFMISSYAFLGLSIATGMGPFGKRPAIVFDVESNNTINTVKLSFNKDGTTTIRDINTGKADKIDLSEFVKTSRIIPVRTTGKREWAPFIGGIMMLGSGAVLLHGLLSIYYKRRKIRRLVAASSKELGPSGAPDKR